MRYENTVDSTSITAEIMALLNHTNLQVINMKPTFLQNIIHPCCIFYILLLNKYLARAMYKNFRVFKGHTCLLHLFGFKIMYLCFIYVCFKLTYFYSHQYGIFADYLDISMNIRDYV